MHNLNSETKAILKSFEEAFRDIAPILLKTAGHVGHKSKTDGSPVTETDIEAENYIIKYVTGKHSNVIILGEESGYNEDALPETCWLLDPIDGTKSFIKNEPIFTNMAVCIRDSQSVACIIYNPSTDELFTAIKGGGAFKNEKRLDISSKPMPSKVYVKSTLAEAISVFLRGINLSCGPAPNGAGFYFSEIAEGKVAARFSLNSKGYLHDYATGALLVQEAGGIIIPVRDAQYSFKTKSFVACHPAMAEIVRLHLHEIKELENSNT